MVGGGIGSFIGGVHRIAAAMDEQIELVCGAFSSDPQKSKDSGAELYLPENRVYGGFEEMIDKEKQLPEGERMDFVSIVTPNVMHAPPARQALNSGFPVICDKPLAYSLAEAKEIKELVDKTGLTFALTHNYTGYPMIKEARDLIKEGKLGKIRKVVVEYPQGWLSAMLEKEGQKQASWRADPKRAGISNCMGDIGTHAANLAEYVTGLKMTEICADLTAFGEGRELDTDGNMLLRFDNGARGVLHASQISAGEENNFKIYVYGEHGGITWHQMEPNSLIVRWLDKPMQIYRTGADRAYLGESAMAHTRLPAGHPEGYLEAFANIYRNFAMTLRARMEGKEPDPQHLDFPTVDDGVRGMAFIVNAVASSKSNDKWHKFTV